MNFVLLRRGFGVHRSLPPSLPFGRTSGPRETRQAGFFSNFVLLTSKFDPRSLGQARTADLYIISVAL